MNYLNLPISTPASTRSKRGERAPIRGGQTRSLALSAIRLYQKTLSFDHGWLRIFFPQGYCKYYPSCSEYGYQAVEKYGVVRGSFKALWRILRCNPWSHGGHDSVG